jgi:hypothetical protein
VVSIACLSDLEENINVMLPTGVEPRFVGHSAHNLATIQGELSRMILLVMSERCSVLDTNQVINLLT